MKTLCTLYLCCLKEFTRNRLAMFWTIAFPVLFILLFGSTFGGDTNASLKVGVVVQDPGQAGAGLAQAFAGVPALQVTQGTEADLMDQLHHGSLNMVVVVPEGLTAALLAGKPASLEVRYDPTNQTTAQIGLTIIEKVVGGFEQAATHRAALLSIAPVTTTVASLRTVDFLLPGILAMALMQLGIFATAPPLVQLRENQVLRRLGATPLPRTTLLTAQVFVRLTIGLTQTALLLLVGKLVFHVQILGNGFLLVGIVLLGAFMFVSLGYLISSLARTMDSVTGLSQLINFPMMFLSGLFFPVDMMPVWIRSVINAMPLTYLADALRQEMVGAIPLHSMQTDLIVVAAWFVVTAVLAVHLFRWE